MPLEPSDNISRLTPPADAGDRPGLTPLLGTATDALQMIVDSIPERFDQDALMDAVNRWTVPADRAVYYYAAIGHLTATEGMDLSNWADQPGPFGYADEDDDEFGFGAAGGWDGAGDGFVGDQPR